MASLYLQIVFANLIMRASRCFYNVFKILKQYSTISAWFIANFLILLKNLPRDFWYDFHGVESVKKYPIPLFDTKKDGVIL